MNARATAVAAVAAVSVSWALAFVLESFPLAVFSATVTLAALVLVVFRGGGAGSVPMRQDAPRRVAERAEEPAHADMGENRHPTEAVPQDHTFEPVVPSTLEPQAVVRALLANAKQFGEPISAHLWLRDPGTATFRLVGADGTIRPDDRPVDADDPVLGRASSEGAVVVSELSRVTADTVGVARTVVRVAFPVDSDEISGVAAVDYLDTAPNGNSISSLGGHMRLSLLCALTLDAAQSRSHEAVGLIDAARELSRALDPDRVIELALARAMRLSGAVTGSIMLLDEEERRLGIVAAQGLPEEIVASTSVAVGEGIAGWVAASGQPVLVEDLPGRRSGGQRRGIRSAVSVPIADEDGLLGVLNVGSRAFPARFTKDHLETLEMLGRQTAVAFRNATALTSASELYFGTLRALALALETKDPYATGGTERVLEYTSAIARALDIEGDELRAVEIAAMLHDIGMTAVGSFGTDCARPLSVVERGLIKMHPIVASEILEQAPALRAVAPIVYHHHEHYDGHGYVSGAAGEDIPLGARVLSVADAYVAMTSDRPYRRALTERQAIAELRDKAGTQFDPDVVRAFIELLGSDSNRVPERD